ncbi:hypothetical protein [Paenibacillus roseipurpureus]|uniref:Uncharacterized protein n=1 Tax=Paenibacillus roseopurpureus TaxID=2918901 RepID=A0AA96LJP7_9BACL|nr:hypothetical protein [Paenibacillus sp. MBLB1832]WNR42233.1 hypothetical protein MJB10_13915 [Paenibacillus sp. MBLB1832]
MKKFTMYTMMAVAFWTLTGCSSWDGIHAKKASVSIQSTGLADKSENDQKHTVLDMSSPSQQAKAQDDPQPRISYLSMNRELADQLMQVAHLGSTAVAMTDKHIYVAVDLGEAKEKGADQTAKDLSKTNDPAKEAGLFGSGKGAQMDWVTAKPIPTETSQAIRHMLTRIYPDSTVFMSSNPLFVSRMMYYDMQQRNNKRMETYLNEFNTMVQYAFPVSQ